MNVKSNLIVLVALGLLAESMAANAVPMNIVLNEDGFGGSGASWLGTFDAGEVIPDGGYSIVTNFNIVLDGVAYNQIPDLFGLILYSYPVPQLSGFVTAGPLSTTPMQ